MQMVRNTGDTEQAIYNYGHKIYTNNYKVVASNVNPGLLSTLRVTALNICPELLLSRTELTNQVGDIYVEMIG